MGKFVQGTDLEVKIKDFDFGHAKSTENYIGNSMMQLYIQVRSEEEGWAREGFWELLAYRYYSKSSVWLRSLSESHK